MRYSLHLLTPILGEIPTELERMNKNRTADCNGVLDSLLL